MAASHADRQDFGARSEPRDEVLHRTRGVCAGGEMLTLTIVNVSPHGLMARCDAPLDAGARIAILLPVIGRVWAEVRWALGGRIGCKLDATIPAARYYELLAALRS